VRPRRSLARPRLMSRGFVVGAPPNGPPADRTPTGVRDTSRSPSRFPVQYRHRSQLHTAQYTVLARSHFEAISHLYDNSSAVRCLYRLLLRANQQPCASTAPPSKLVVVTEACVSAFGRFSNARLAYRCCLSAVHIIILLFRVRRAVRSRFFPAAPKNSKVT